MKLPSARPRYSSSAQNELDFYKCLFSPCAAFLPHLFCCNAITNQFQEVVKRESLIFRNGRKVCGKNKWCIFTTSLEHFFKGNAHLVPVRIPRFRVSPHPSPHGEGWCFDFPLCSQGDSLVFAWGAIPDFGRFTARAAVSLGGGAALAETSLIAHARNGFTHGRFNE